MRAALFAIVMALLSTPVFAGEKITTGRAACQAIKARASKVLDQKIAGPASGWTCESGDIRPDGGEYHPAYYIMRLNSDLKCSYPCSNLLGWYAVRKSTGQVRNWDIAQDIPGSPL
jgi:hypothetical protein